MKVNILNKNELIETFKSIENPFQALEIKNNIQEAIEFLKTPSTELLKMLEKEGFDPSLLTSKQEEKPQKQKTERKVNIETRSFLIENNKPVKILHGRAVSSEIEKGNTVLKYDDLEHDQQIEAKKLI